MLTLGMVILGLITFAAIYGFIDLCDRVLAPGQPVVVESATFLSPMGRCRQRCLPVTLRRFFAGRHSGQPVVLYSKSYKNDGLDHQADKTVWLCELVSSRRFAMDATLS